MAVYRRGNSWVADFYIGDVRMRKAFPNKKMGEAFEREQKHAEFTGQEMPLQQKKVSLLNFIKHYQRIHDVQNNLSTQTLNNYVFGHLQSFLNNPLLSRIEKAQIEEYKAQRIQKVKPVTVNIELRVIRSFFNRGVEWGYLRESPMKGVKLMRLDEQEPRFLRPGEGAKFIAEAKGQIKTFVMLGLHTGLRKGEMYHGSLTLLWREEGQISWANEIVAYSKDMGA